MCAFNSAKTADDWRADAMNILNEVPEEKRRAALLRWYQEYLIHDGHRAVRIIEGKMLADPSLSNVNRKRLEDLSKLIGQLVRQLERSPVAPWQIPILPLPCTPN